MDSVKPRQLLGVFDATMIVMGGIVGSGIFINPYVVALRVHTPFLILGVWLLGGGLALLGAFIWAELASRLPGAGGQYLYLREAYHPSVAFIYGWVLLLVTQTGGMAAVAVTFSRYYREITGLSAGDGPIAAATLLGLTAINCFGVRAGSNVQSVLMLLKAAAIAAMVVVGMHWGGGTVHALPLLDRPVSLGLGSAIGAAMIPVAFAYGGWQTASFVAGEMRDPRRDLSRGLVIGVIGVVVLYLAVNFVCLRVLGPDGLAATRIPASAVMRAALGERGAQWIAFGIAISTLGLSEPGNSDRAAGVLRHGPRRPLLQECRLAFSPHRRSGCGHRAARRDRHCDRALRTLRADLELRDLRGFHFLRLDGGVAVCIQAKGCGFTREAVSGSGPSLHYRAFRAGLCRHRDHHRRDLPGEFCHRPGHSAGRLPGIFVLEPQGAAKSSGAEPMRHRHSDYMLWAKTQGRAKYNLATSGVGFVSPA